MTADAQSRRGFFARLVGLGAMVWGAGQLLVRRWVRPPGAVSDFAARCIRCFRCAEVCPVGAIRVDGATVDIFAQGTPYIEASTRACILCMECTHVCPTDALVPVEAKLSTIATTVRMGTPIVDRELCITLSRKGNCRLCFEVCPYAGKAVTLTGYAQGPAFFEKYCVGCGLCAEACPSDAKAITIEGFKELEA